MRTLCSAAIACMIAACGVLSGSAASADPPGSPQPRATMQNVFSALVTLLPLSLDEERFADPASADTINQSLEVLTNSVSKLEAHGGQRDADFRNLSLGLASDVAEIRLRYELGRYDEARYFVLESTRSCVACHSRLPSAREFPMADQLLDGIDFSDRSVHERAQVLVTVRRFDDALTAWETFFADPEAPPGQFDVGGYMIDYLTVAIRVQRNPERARRTLRKLAKRTDVPLYLQRRLQQWIADLGDAKSILAEATPEAKLERARGIIRRAGTLGDPSGAGHWGRDGAALDLLASALLLQAIDSKALSSQQASEAFYLLGVAESRSIDAYWVPQTEHHLESAIRADPKGPHAEHAYMLLEEYVVLGYGGSTLDHLPADVWANLDELRKLTTQE